ncbi:hypothetical protein ABK040_006052 [Willaertia magna]
MFITTVIRDTVILKPQFFHKDHISAIEDEIHFRYCNKILPDVGLCIGIYDFISIGDPSIYPNQQGSCFVDTTFRLIIFRPFIGETITGRIMSADPETGLRIAIGFFNDIYIPPYLLAQPCQYDDDTNQWNWVYEDNTLPYAYPQEIRFRVNAIQFNTMIDSTPPKYIDERKKLMEQQQHEGEQKQEEQKEEKPPMIIYGRVNEPGLGLTSWWAPSEESQMEETNE